MSGRVGDLSLEQEKALKKLKQAVADVHCSKYDDHYYLRWLRARNFSVSKAEIMMRKHLAFRKKMGADTILQNYKPHPIVDKYYPRSYLGTDKEGCPVRLMPFQYLDFKGFLYSVQKIEVFKFLTYLFEQDIEQMERMSKEKGKVIEKHSYIIDLDGYTFRQASNKDALSMFNDVLKIYEANYPERMKVTYFINAPIYFNIILNLSKPFLSENTIQKFRVYGKDFINSLLEDMDADILPKYLGGNRTDPDGNPMCKTIINFGGMIPEELYNINSTTKSIVKEKDVNVIKVSNQSFEEVEIPVSDSDTILEWIVETPSKDIAFGLYYKTEKSSPKYEELIALERVSCHLVPETGTFTCDRPGIYVLRFSNTYSWITTKKVYYKYTLISSSDFDECSEMTSL